MRRCLFVVSLCLFAVPVSAQQNVNLTEATAARECHRIEIRTKVDGERIYYQAGGKKSQPVKLEAGHRCIERIASTNPTTKLPAKVARIYEAARSNLVIGSEQPVDQTLRVDRALIVAVRNDDGFMAFSPKGPLTREELELIGEHFDTLMLPGLLPGKETPVGGTWEIANGAVIGLCQFEALEQHSLTGKLETLAGNEAKLSISGNAKGIESGAQVVLTVTAHANFDVAKRKITSLEWKQEDQRDQGPVSPGFKATVTVNITREMCEEPAGMKEQSLESVLSGSETPAGMTAVSYRDPNHRFQLTHPREWRLTSVTELHTTMRLVDRGDLISQANITMLERATPGQHMAPAEFKEKMMSSPGWEPGQVIEESEVRGRAGRFIYRLAAGGMIGDKQVVQTFYLVSEPNGEQAVVAFQTEKQKAAKMASRELPFVDGLDLTSRR